MRGRSVLITGATGFIGSHLARRLLHEGAQVHVLARENSSLARLQGVLDRVSIWRTGLGDAGAIRDRLKASKPEFIFHLAGSADVRHPATDLSEVLESVEVNLKGTLNLLQAVHLAGHAPERFVRVGGLEEYGRGPVPYLETQREDPVSAYSASQVATTYYCQMLQKRLDFPILTVRPALVYGPAQGSKFFIPSLIAHALRNEDFTMNSSAEGRDLIYIDDLIDGLLRTLVSPALYGEIINIGSGREYVMLEVGQRILALLGSGIRLKTSGPQKRPNGIPHLQCSNEKARALLGWKPTVSLEDGLMRTIEWFRSDTGR